MQIDEQNKVSNGLLFFVKYPKIGKVKSRLSDDFDDTFVLKLYEKFVEDLLEMLNTEKFSVIICYHPTGTIENYKKWLGEDYTYISQEGKDLGERLKNCFQKGFNLGFEKLIVIGSDSPDLPINIITDSFDALDENDTVIGPCQDGGYYLLGFNNKSFIPETFQDIKWSTSTVFEKTMENLYKKASKTFILPQLSDVDTVEDLKNLYKRNKETDFKNSNTMIFLEKYFQDKI
jgi:rSAM/selenodomain-associated transferase 1